MINLSSADRIVTMTLSRPPVNAINTEWLALLDHGLDELAARADWHVLHLRSDQKVFCAGADLSEIRERFGAEDGPDQMLAIGGAAMGGGLELALACDLRIVAAEAKLGLPEARLGLIPGGGGTQRLARLCGRAVASRLILGAEVIDGEMSAALGIAHWSVPRAELPGRAAEVARRLAELPAAALAACKQCIAAAGEPGRGGYSDELEHTRRLLTNPDTQRRVEAFLSGSLQ